MNRFATALALAFLIPMTTVAGPRTAGALFVDGVSASGAKHKRGLIIGGTAVEDSPEHYHQFAKHLTVSPARRSASAFSGDDAQAIRRLEDPLRRQIFDAMRRNRGEAFRFATLRKAQENFQMRVVAVGFMFKIQKKSGADFDFASTGAADAADKGHWTRTGRFTHASREGMAASDCIDGLMRERFRGECLGTMQANVLHAARQALGKARFDSLHSKGLAIGPKMMAASVHIRQARTQSTANMVPGDWAYMKNKDDYGTDLRPGKKVGAWSGENAMYLGKFEKGPNGNPKFSSRATPRFSGLGAYAMSEDELRAKLKENYLKEMCPPRTWITHTIEDSDIRWSRVDRLITGG